MSFQNMHGWYLLKIKLGKLLVIAFKSVLKSGRSPKSLQTDKGTEFKNKEFQNFLKTKKIHFFTTENPETKASIVESFQRTLKTRMWKYFTHHRTLHGYNHAYHRSIKCAPVSVTLKNEPQVSENFMENQILKKSNQNSKWAILYVSIKQNVHLIKVIYQTGHKNYFKF